MAHLQYYNYEGWGEFASFINSQATRIGSRVICAGQGGWIPDQKNYDMNAIITKSLEEEIAQAFENAQIALLKAGAKGWSQVYRIVTYSTDISAQNEFIFANINKWCPDHKPVWTQLGVAHLAFPSMHFEIDVEAHDESNERVD